MNKYIKKIEDWLNEIIFFTNGDLLFLFCIIGFLIIWIIGLKRGWF